MRINLVWIALVVTVFSTIPQMLQVVKTKEARDFNTTSIFLAMIANTLIGIEALRKGYTATVVLSIWLLTYWALISYYKLYPPTGVIIRSQKEGEF
jgi:uncharacterized protein with PQ loop repeat